MKIYITFGSNHKYRIGETIIDHNCLASLECENVDDGRAKVYELFSGKFCTTYMEATDELLNCFPRGIVPIPEGEVVDLAMSHYLLVDECQTQCGAEGLNSTPYFDNVECPECIRLAREQAIEDINEIIQVHMIYTPDGDEVRSVGIDAQGYISCQV